MPPRGSTNPRDNTGGGGGERYQAPTCLLQLPCHDTGPAGLPLFSHPFMPLDHQKHRFYSKASGFFFFFNIYPPSCKVSTSHMHSNATEWLLEVYFYPDHPSECRAPITRSACLLSITIFFSFYVCTCGIWKFPGQGPNDSCSCDVRHSHNNTGSLTH